MSDKTPEFAVLVLEKVIDGRTAEHHLECQTFEEALAGARTAAEKLPSWMAITIVHATDYPKVLENAASEGQDKGESH